MWRKKVLFKDVDWDAVAVALEGHLGRLQSEIDRVSRQYSSTMEFYFFEPTMTGDAGTKIWPVIHVSFLHKQKGRRWTNGLSRGGYNVNLTDAEFATAGKVILEIASTFPDLEIVLAENTDGTLKYKVRLKEVPKKDPATAPKRRKGPEEVVGDWFAKRERVKQVLAANPTLSITYSDDFPEIATKSGLPLEEVRRIAQRPDLCRLG